MQSKMRRRDLDGGGFTLLELLVAMALSAMLVALLGESIAGLRASSTASSEAAVTAAQSLAGERTLTLLLSGAMPSAVPAGASTLVGTTRSMEFIAAPPQALAASGMLKVRLSVEPVSASRVGIYAEVAPHDPMASGSARADRRLLLRDLSAARFEYAAWADAELRPEWVGGGRLPALVRILVERGDVNAEPRQVEVFIALRRQQTGGCVLEPVSMSCRGADGR